MNQLILACLLILACSITYNISFIATQMAEGSQECFLLALDQSSPGSPSCQEDLHSSNGSSRSPSCEDDPYAITCCGDRGRSHSKESVSIALVVYQQWIASSRSNPSCPSSVYHNLMWEQWLQRLRHDCILRSQGSGCCCHDTIRQS